MCTYYLEPINDRAKSFYGKAKVIEKTNGDVELQSYDTIVARISKGKLQRLWDGYSSTTMRHVNSFCTKYGVDSGGKSWWKSLEVTK